MKKAVCYFMVISMLFISGCWDKVEVNDRAYVVSLGLDEKEKKIQATYTIPNLPVVTGQGGEGDVKFVKKTEGVTLHEANKNFGEISNQLISFDHVKTIVFGDKFIQSDKLIKKAVDHFDRSPDYAKTILVVATSDTAESLLEAKPNAGNITGEYISQSFDKESTDEFHVFQLNLGEFIIDMHDKKGLTILPVINFENKELKIDGVVILKDFKKAFNLDNEQAKALSWIRGEGGDMVANFEYEDNPMQFKINNMEREVRFNTEDTTLVVDMSLQVEGDLVEFTLSEEESLYDTELIKKLEERIKESMEKSMNEVLREVQKEVGKDIFQLDVKFKVAEPNKWEEMKDDWDAHIQGARININVKPKIRRIGMSE